jgi:hypothetical protein
LLGDMHGGYPTKRQEKRHQRSRLICLGSYPTKPPQTLTMLLKAKATNTARHL